MLRVPREGESLSTHANAKGADYIIDRETGCWLWLKTLNRPGYGTGSFRSVGIETQYAHRAYYIAANGPLEPGMGKVIDHLCRNPSCVNPAHLELVVPSRNVKRGVRAKLTDEQAEEIRERLRGSDLLVDIARDYGVNEDTIWTIASGIAWREDYSKPPEPIRPIAHCKECGELITTGQRHKTFCCAAHRRRYNQRHGYHRRKAAKRAAFPRKELDR